MDKFDELELNGRKLLESFLIQVGATNLYPTEDKYAPVDYYFTYKDKKVVAEIKVRDIKYEGYDTHLMEVSKYKSLVKDEKDSQSDTAYLHISVIPTQAFRSYPPSLFPIKWHWVANL